MTTDEPREGARPDECCPDDRAPRGGRRRFRGGRRPARRCRRGPRGRGSRSSATWTRTWSASSPLVADRVAPVRPAAPGDLVGGRRPRRRDGHPCRRDLTRAAGGRSPVARSSPPPSRASSWSSCGHTVSEPESSRRRRARGGVRPRPRVGGARPRRPLRGPDGIGPCRTPLADGPGGRPRSPAPGAVPGAPRRGPRRQHVPRSRTQGPRAGSGPRNEAAGHTPRRSSRAPSSGTASDRATTERRRPPGPGPSAGRNLRRRSGPRWSGSGRTGPGRTGSGGPAPGGPAPRGRRAARSVPRHADRAAHRHRRSTGPGPATTSRTGPG